MPAIRNDIIIKRKQLRGLFDAANHQAKEIEEHDLLASCQDLDEKLHDTYVPFRDALIEVTEEMKKRLTKHVVGY